MKYLPLVAMTMALTFGSVVFAQDKPAEQKPPIKWTGNITVSASDQTGNTERTSSTVSAETTKKSEIDRIYGKFLNNYAEESKVVSTRNTYGQGKYDYFVSKQWYVDGSLELYNDDFKNLKLRTTIAPSMGYQIWSDNIKSLLVEAGVAYISDTLRKTDANNKDKNWMAGRIASTVSYKVGQVIVFADALIFYPSFKAEDGSKLRNEASATSALGSGWALKLTNIIDRNSKPPTGVKKVDSTWTLGLQYNY
jgi:putative salt-induced outer membrane protein YdiY